MSHEDDLRQLFAAKADELNDRIPPLRAITGERPATIVGLPWYRRSRIGAWSVAAVAAAAIIAVAVALGGTQNSDRITTGPEFAAAEATAAVPTQTARNGEPVGAPDVDPVPAASPAPTATEVPPPTPTPTPVETVLLPADDWTVQYVTAQINPPATEDLVSRYAALDGDLFGPVIQAYYLPEADYRRVGNPGGPYYDLVTPGGRIVRVRTDFAPVSLLAVVQHDPGSFVVIGYGLGEAELVQAIDAVSIEDDVLTYASPLPAGLTVVPATTQQFQLADYSLKRSEEEQMQVTIFPPDLWQMALGQRETHPSAEPIEGDGFRGIVYDRNQNGDDAGAALVTEDAILLIWLPRWSQSSPALTVDEVRTIIEGFASRPAAPIYEALGLLDRSEVYGDWIESTPLPDDLDVSWLLEGPPVDPSAEAFLAHQVFSCAWVGEWLATGDGSALDEIEASGSWPTAALLVQQDLGPVGRYDFAIAEAHALTTSAERATSGLAIDCSWLVGVDSGN